MAVPVLTSLDPNAAAHRRSRFRIVGARERLRREHGDRLERRRRADDVRRRERGRRRSSSRRPPGRPAHSRSWFAIPRASASRSTSRSRKTRGRGRGRGRDRGTDDGLEPDRYRLQISRGPVIPAHGYARVRRWEVHQLTDIVKGWLASEALSLTDPADLPPPPARKRPVMPTAPSLSPLDRRAKAPAEPVRGETEPEGDVVPAAGEAAS